MTRVLAFGLFVALMALAAPAGAEEGPAYVNVPTPTVGVTDVGSPVVATPTLQPSVLGARGVLRSTEFAVTGADIVGIIALAVVSVFFGFVLVRSGRIGSVGGARSD